MSLAVDASAVVALHFLDERPPFEPLEERLASGEQVFTAPNFHQEVMEALRRGTTPHLHSLNEDCCGWPQAGHAVADRADGGIVLPVVNFEQAWCSRRKNRRQAVVRS